MLSESFPYSHNRGYCTQAKVFSIVDSKEGFLQVALDEHSCFLTTFWTPCGRYRWLSCHLESSFKDHLISASRVIAAIHDVKIFGSGGSISISHNIAFETLLNRYREQGLRLNEKKLHLKLSKVRYMGHIVGADGLQVNPEKIKAVHDMPCPTEVQEVQHLIGLHLSKFLSQLSTICEPLHRLTTGNSVFDWLPQHGDVFCKVMEMITKASVLRYFDVNKGVMIECSSPDIALGNVLTQDGRPSSISLIRAYTIQVHLNDLNITS